MKNRTNKGLGRQVLAVRRSPGNGSRAILSYGPLFFRAAIGRSGTTTRKREGDGGTPVAEMKILGGYRRMDRIRFPRNRLLLKPIGSRDLWCDEPGHPSYNRPVSAPCKASHEEMRRADELYDLCLVLDWNLLSRKRFGGSAIFFHIAKPDYGPTAGCVAISPRDMLRLLPVLRRGTVLKVYK